MTKYVAFILLAVSVAGCATSDPRQFSQGQFSYGLGYRTKNYMDYMDPVRNHALRDGGPAGGVGTSGP